jgi:hypothetical protein
MILVFAGKNRRENGITEQGLFQGCFKAARTACPPDVVRRARGSGSVRDPALEPVDLCLPVARAA